MMTFAPAKRSGLVQRLDDFENLFRQKEPRIHAFLPEADRFQRLRKDASALHRKYPKKDKRPPLFGLLLGVKDIFHVDGFATGAGSRLPARELRGKEATSVTALKRAGMLVAGKTVTTEFAYFYPGHTRNPHATDHTPGGSSSGSAAAVAAGLVDLALGTQTIGSVIRPASYCGVVGFKPSYGRFSANGVIPLAPSFDHVGLFAQDVAVISRAAAVLGSNWKPTRGHERKPHLAVPNGEYLARANAEMRHNFEAALDSLEVAGYAIKRIEQFKDFEEIVQRHQLILAAEAARTHAPWFETYRHLYQAKTIGLIERGNAISDKELETALDAVSRFRLDISTVMDIHGIDAWVSPAATGPAPKGLASTGDPVMNLPWTQAGLPVMGLPSASNEEGLPLGLQFSAGFNRDEDLLDWAPGIQAALKGRR
ncbi:MAG: amidase [Anaerolineales bacterium]